MISYATHMTGEVGGSPLGNVVGSGYYDLKNWMRFLRSKVKFIKSTFWTQNWLGYLNFDFGAKSSMLAYNLISMKW